MLWHLFQGMRISISAFSEGKDIHAITASKVFNIPLEEVTSDIDVRQRRLTSVLFTASAPLA